MGMVIFEESGTFNPTDWGLAVGDMLQVICVGGGAGGAATAEINKGWRVVSGNAGGTSSFGSHLSAEGASADVSAPNGMGKGGAGSKQENSNGTYSMLPGGGAGGFLPGVPIWGGDGGDGVYYDFNATAGVPVNSHAPSGLGGKGAWDAKTSYQYESFVDLPFANLKTKSNGNRGATCAGHRAAAGNGYGAGGTGSSYGSEASWAEEPGPSGGNSGDLKIGTVKLTSTAGIAVTVGSGGAGAVANGLYNSKATAGNGAPGVVVVTW